MRPNKLNKEVGFGCLVSGLELPWWWPHLLEHQWELDLWVMELFGALSLAELGWDCSRLDDLNAVMADPVTWSHFIVHLFNSTIQSCITVLLVHVVIPGSALVPQPYPKIFYSGRVLLKDLETPKTTVQ